MRRGAGPRWRVGAAGNRASAGTTASKSLEMVSCIVAIVLRACICKSRLALSSCSLSACCRAVSEQRLYALSWKLVRCRLPLGKEMLQVALLLAQIRLVWPRFAAPLIGDGTVTKAFTTLPTVSSEEPEAYRRRRRQGLLEHPIRLRGADSTSRRSASAGTTARSSLEIGVVVSRSAVLGMQGREVLHRCYRFVNAATGRSAS